MMLVDSTLRSAQRALWKLLLLNASSRILLILIERAAFINNIQVDVEVNVRHHSALVLLLSQPNTHVRKQLASRNRRAKQGVRMVPLQATLNIRLWKVEITRSAQAIPHGCWLWFESSCSRKLFERKILVLRTCWKELSRLTYTRLRVFFACCLTSCYRVYPWCETPTDM